ncbi:MAG: hypothetical protein BGO69_05360 [Bacteroidetes bacterium 46-16]|nr:MAG: hypothetical protein BGO69_05360 [Bacteroidetes bacterium 46-16]
MKKEEDRKLLPIEKYSHFKGIYLTTTQEYYLCDFYEITHVDSPSFYRVSADLRGNNKIVEVIKIGNDWNITPSVLPYELELEIIKIVEEVCIPKSKKPDK